MSLNTVSKCVGLAWTQIMTLFNEFYGEINSKFGKFPRKVADSDVFFSWLL